VKRALVLLILLVGCSSKVEVHTTPEWKCKDGYIRSLYRCSEIGAEDASDLIRECKKAIRPIFCSTVTMFYYSRWGTQISSSTPCSKAKLKAEKKACKLVGE